jgi:glycosyltransferase involved in cell wall biosynthesis
MYDNLLIVFSNYNGNRSCNDFSTPRIKVTIDSFKRQVPYADDLNVLLLDNGSTDGSEKMLQEYQSAKWKYHRKTTEDFYLGTMCRLLREYKSKYQYMMLVDNDHFFFRPGFLDTAMTLLATEPGFACLQLNEVTTYDLIDHYKKPLGVAGIFEKVGFINGDPWLRSARFKGGEEHFRKMPKEKGLGIVAVPNNFEKRICWLYFAASNCIIDTQKFATLFDRPELSPPYKRNAERLALFAASVRSLGHSAYLGRGASINIGFRKFLPSKVSVVDLVDKYSSGHKSLHMTDGYSYFLKDRKLCSIEEEIERARTNA